MKLCSCSSPLYIQYLIPLPKKLAVKEKKNQKTIFQDNVLLGETTETPQAASSQESSRGALSGDRPGRNFSYVAWVTFLFRLLVGSLPLGLGLSPDYLAVPMGQIGWLHMARKVLGEHLSEKQVQPSYDGALRGTHLFCGSPSLKPWPCVFFPAPSSNTPGFGTPLHLISHPLLCSIASKHRGLQLLMSRARSQLGWQPARAGGVYYSCMYHHHPVDHQYMFVE